MSFNALLLSTERQNAVWRQTNQRRASKKKKKTACERKTQITHFSCACACWRSHDCHRSSSLLSMLLSFCCCCCYLACKLPQTHKDQQNADTSNSQKKPPKKKNAQEYGCTKRKSFFLFVKKRAEVCCHLPIYIYICSLPTLHYRRATIIKTISIKS